MSVPRHPSSTSNESRANCAERERCEDLTDSSASLFPHLRCAALWTAFLCCVVVCAWVATMKPVRAESFEENQTVDISSLSCADLLRMPLPQALIVVGWIGGFYAGLKNDTRVQVLKFADDADKIITLCRTSGSTSVMTLVERTFGLVRPPRP